jgi:GNAT superfamily N-acetyltransferase
LPLGKNLDCYSFIPTLTMAALSNNETASLSIRRATMRDAPVIAELNLALALETEDLRLNPETVHAGVRGLLEDPAKGLYFVAETSDTIAGQLMITYEWSDWRNGNLWWIQSVYVRPEFRRHGVFRALLDYLETLAVHRSDVAGLRLYMHASNERARRTYQDLGLHPTEYQVFEKELSRK